MQPTAVEIIERHYDAAWRARIMAQHRATTGRYTKAKQHERDRAEFREAIIKAIIADLKAAGYTVTE